MSFHLISKRIDFESGGEKIVLIHEDTALEHGVNPGDHIVISNEKYGEAVCLVNTSQDEVDKNHIAIYRDVYEEYGFKNDIQILITLLEKPKSVAYIRDKIKKHTLSYEKIYEIMKDIASNRLGVIEKTYFLSTIYNPGYSEEELYFLAKAMADTGDTIKFDGIVGDKHSIGGVPGKGITPLVVSIVAAVGIRIPNTSTRSITTPSGTTDILETITKVAFTPEQVREFVEKVNACMVWGGGLNLAPADDELIRVERPMDIESFDKFIVSIIAKKIAMGITHLVLDIPAGPGCKVERPEDVLYLKNKFVLLGKRFGITILALDRYPKGIDGNGVGPILEMREVLYILENNPHKSKELEEEALRIAGQLIELCGKAQPGMGQSLAKDTLYNGKAFSKFKDIIGIQGGNPNISSYDLIPAKSSMIFKAVVEGTISRIDNRKVDELATILGCPLDKSAGIYFYKKVGDVVSLHDSMFALYSKAEDRLNTALTYIQRNNLFVM